MSTIQRGEWRRGDDGEFKVFIRGCSQLNNTAVEVISRAGDISYAVITGTHKKISGGYLYNCYRTGKPETVPTVSTLSTGGINVVEPQPKTRTIGAEISAEELDAALGLD